MAAQAQGMSPDDLRQMILGQINGIRPMFQGTPDGDKLLAAAEAFIKEPHNLKIMIRPKNALPIMMLALQAKTNPMSLVNTLGLYVSFNDGEELRFAPNVPGTNG